MVLSSTMYNMWYLLWHKLELSVKSQQVFTLSLGLLKSNYNSCTGRSSENMCSTSGSAQEKGKRG